MNEPAGDPAAAVLLAVSQFNAREFWDCHETLEDFWGVEDGPLRAFYHGFIQVAAGFLHVQRGNWHGAVRLLGEGAAKLTDFRPRCMCVDVAQLLEDVANWRRELARLGPDRLREAAAMTFPVVRIGDPAATSPCSRELATKVNRSENVLSTTAQEGFVTANGLRLHYLDWGGDGAPLLLLHPTGFHAHVWEPYARRLSQRYRCLALDSRGHGDSDKPGVYGWPDFAADLIAFLGALELEAVVGVGHSAGATMIAVAAAQQSALFSKAVLLDPILFFDGHQTGDPSTNSLGEGARKRRMTWPSREAVLDRYGSRPPFDGWEREFLELYVRYGVRDNADGTVTLKCSGDDEAEMFRWGPRPLPCEEILPRVACPVLLIGGGDSQSFPRERARRAAGLLPRCEPLTIAGVGHFVPFERPAETQAAIDGFLGAG